MEYIRSGDKFLGTPIVVKRATRLIWHILENLMNIQNIIKAVSAKDIKKAQQKAKAHFELGGIGNTQMNMIAFD